MPESLNILFVDGNKHLLRSLARVTAASGQPWQASFAQSGSNALASLSGHNFDVIVSDANLPDMSGCELLEHVRTHCPLSLRILMTEQAQNQTVFALLKCAHQLLTKPCPTQLLLDAVHSAYRLRALFMNPEVRRTVHQLDQLPVIPAVYAQLNTELAKDDFTVQAVGDIIAQDMGLTAGILKIINSAYFGLSRRVDSPQQAVTILGANMLKGLVVYDQVFKAMDPGKYPNFDVRRLWTHCLDAARSCRTVALAAGLTRQDAENAFLAGLLHDIGKIVLNEGAPDMYLHILKTSQTDNRPLVEVEQAELKTTHAEIGAYILGLWGFEDSVIQPIAAHHRPSLYEASTNVTSILHVVNVCLHDSYRQHAHRPAHQLDTDFLHSSGTAQYVEEWCNLITAEQQKLP